MRTYGRPVNPSIALSPPDPVAFGARLETLRAEVLLPQPLAPGQSTILALDFRISAPTTLDKGYGLISYTRDILALDTPYAPIPVFDDEGSGVYELTVSPPGGGTISDKGKYVVVYRQQADGTWKAVADIFNSSQPAG